MSTPLRIVWETRWELEARLRRTVSSAQRDALRMLLALRSCEELSDFELSELVGRAPHEIRQWWRMYEGHGLATLLECAVAAPWQAITGVAVPRTVEASALPFGRGLDARGRL